MDGNIIRNAADAAVLFCAVRSTAEKRKRAIAEGLTLLALSVRIRDPLGKSSVTAL